MIKTLKYCLFFVMLCCCWPSCFSQEFSQEKLYNTFDQNVGIENTNLYQGIIYTQEYRVNNDKAQFFKGSDFSKGAVQYDGQTYYDLDLKYDVYDDRLLVKLVPNAGGGTLVLFNQFVKSFELGGSDFVKIDQEEAPEIDFHGFYEVSFDSPGMTLYTKFRKKSIQKKDRNYTYYEFVDTSSDYVLKYNDKYNMLKSKKDLTDLFPQFKKEINKFYVLARGLRKSNPDDFQIALLKRVEILLSQTTNQS